MGADLVVTVLEIEKGQTPNWNAAEEFLKTLSVEDKVNAYLDVTGGDDGDEYDPENVKNACNAVDRSFRSVKAGWDGEFRNVVRLPGVKTTMLIAGDMSWGDEVEECSDMCLFIESGMAEAAGFLKNTG